MSQHDLSWAVPVMRIGYAGRGIVYLVVAGFSLYAIWRGGQAESTSSALSQLETTWWGNGVLLLIFIGMMAYAVWRLLDAFYDLEAYGADGTGIIARIGMVVTGLAHLSIGILAFSLLFTGGGGSGQGSSIPRAIGWVMRLPGGRWIVGVVGLIVIGAGVYYLHKAWKEKYRRHLRANRFTTRWNVVLKAGVAAQGVVIAIVGLLFVYAALQADPSEAGGVGEAFQWLSQQAYGQILVAVVCIGLLGFAIFCFVNAAYRIVPKVAGDDVETLAARLKDKAESVA
ncbi:DUF1206 domain-containing protein [Roseitranquillus sediminis]|uniref:DUF1206 domain-containing protein n=1 Tax=Roseitranquillus sediminis TaxID=2809051 RepID=UPI001D0CD83A|nr:DUF1206 domain-containing protein [Roseitranquillus sediminis]MBM9595647.1 DUF1206 domain-containing protein [Roseitranquillus sediminis]